MSSVSSHQHRHNRPKKPAAHTSGLFVPGLLMNAPVIATNIASTVASVAAIASVVSTLDQYRQGYLMGQHIYNTARPLLSAVGLTSAQNNNDNSADSNSNAAEPAATLMSSMLLWNGWKTLSYLMKQGHGKIMEKKVHLMNAVQLNDARAIGSNVLTQWKAAYYDRMGRRAPPTFLKEMPTETKIILGGFLLALATYLHTDGMQIMVKHTRAMETDLKYTANIDPFERLCYNLYLNNEYYTKTGNNNNNWSFEFHPVRVVANTMIGMFRNIGLLQSDADDPVKAFVKGAKVVGYWEVLAHLIGLYGWAPVYMATHWLAESIVPKK